MQNPEAIAWTIATEGSIALTGYHNKRRSQWTLRPIISVGNTNEKLCIAFQQLVGMGRVYGGNNAYGKRFAWVLSSLEECAQLLESIIPFLPIKQEQAEWLLRYCESRMEKRAAHYNTTYSDFEYFCWEHLRELNKKQHKKAVETTAGEGAR